MVDTIGLTRSELVSSYGNSKAANEVLFEAVKALPQAALELSAEAWSNPLDTAWHLAKTAGTGAVFGTAFGYLVPGRGPTAAVLAVAFTAPMLSGTYKRIEQARLDASRSGANIEAIAHGLARDSISAGADLALGMAGGIAGAKLGREIAMSDTGAGRFAQSAQRVLLSAENKAMDSIARLMPGKRSTATLDSAPLATHLLEPNAKFERLDFEKMSWISRQQTLLSNRLDQYAARDPKMQMYYGSLHGHSVYSDGMGTPAQIYASAKRQGIDFTAVTDHSHTAARGGVKPGDPRYPGQQKVPTVAENPAYYLETIKAANEASVNGKFAAIYGVEFGTIGKVGSSGKSGVNHINILQTETFFQSVKTAKPRRIFDPVRGLFRAAPEAPAQVPDVKKIADGNYKVLVDHLDQIKDATGGRPVIQLNHPRFSVDESPNLPAKLRGRDYGQKSFKSQQEWVDRFGKYASQMEILNGDAIKRGILNDSASLGRAHEVDFAGYIDKGLRLSPTFGRDFHYGDPGGTRAATGVLAGNLDQTSIINALRARRTIATTNLDNLTGSMSVNNVHPMGSVLDQRAVPDLTLKVKVGGDISPKAEYKAMLWGDRRIGDGKLAAVMQTQTLSGAELAKAGNTISFEPVRQVLGAKGAYWVEIQRIPSAADTAGSLARSLSRTLPLSELSLNGGVSGLRHNPLPSGLPADSGSAFIGDRMWTAPVWSEPLAGKDHSLLLRSLIGIGSTFLSQ